MTYCDANDTQIASYIFEYDSLGRLIRSAQVAESTVRQRTEHIYDSYNRLSSQSYVIGGLTFTERYTYSDGSSGDGTLTQMTAGNGAKITFTYDALKRLSGRVVKNGSTVVTTSTYGYKNKSTSGSTITTTGILESLEIENKNGTTLVDEKHTYDAVGNITQISKNTGSNYPLAKYTYGSQNQLTKEVLYNGNGTADSNITKTYEYTYDTAGNILTEKVGGSVTKTYTYGNSQWIDLLTAFNGQPIVYEGQTYNASTGAVTGSPQSGNPMRYTNGQYSYYMEWSHGNRLGYLAFDDGEWQYQASFGYDADGIRTYKNVDGTNHYYLTQNGKVVRETIGTGSTAKVLDFLYAESGKLFALNYSTNGGSTFTTYYYVLNLQGDVVKLIGASGTVYANYTYNAWGELLSVTNASGNVITDYSHISHVNPLRYRGYYYDRETNWYYLQSRYYDPITHRFINADALASTGQGILGTNMFAYCNNNPINLSDYSGHLAIVAWLTTYATANWWNVSGWVAAAAIPLAVAGLYIGDYLYNLYLEENSNYIRVPVIAEEDPATTEEEPTEPEPPDVTYPGDDPAIAPEGYEWHGPDSQGGKRGGYVNPNGKDSWHPDLNHPGKVKPHWDYNDCYGYKWRVFPDGSFEFVK